MNPVPSIDRPRLEWDVACRISPGEEISGDLHLVKAFPGGALAAVVDGLGHGGEATLAARAAIDVLTAHTDEPVIRLVERCHAALKPTRGAVMTVVSFDFASNHASALGIGNVETVLIRANRTVVPLRELVLLRGGIVGDQLPALHASDFAVEPGDVLVFATDGIREGFWEQLNVVDSIRQLVNRILAQHFRGNDDALVLAVRYLGESGAKEG
ncbi:MAG: hypothetical protein K0R17_680 [Rariglobus sp.]|nr:hypothetical protein [Rariglobus sp.]